jgi:FkbM family methyltransferase
VENFLIWDFFQRNTIGFFVEVGAHDPLVFSQTWLLERYGWKGILIEPQAACCEKLRQQRPNSTIFQVACTSPEGKKIHGEAKLFLGDTASSLKPNMFDPSTTYRGVEIVKLMTLDEILEEVGFDKKLDFLSIDTEGSELEILHGFNIKKYNPTLILVEYHVYSLKLHNYLKDHGYKLVRRTKNNNWYIPKSVKFPVNTSERLALLRKMYLGTPFRKLKLFFKRLKADHRR